MAHLEQYAQYLPLFYDGDRIFLAKALVFTKPISVTLIEVYVSWSTYMSSSVFVSWYPMGIEPIAILRPQPIQSYLLKNCHKTFTYY
uniref:Uncharacterized protein n=1 Tax=Glossina palpalis gambiensis TaxID=67801 RepID=A0A1B0ALE8_9MUSC